MARAQQVDVTVYGGSSLPFYEASLPVRPNLPSLPGVSIEQASELIVHAGGGPVFGGSVAWQPGLFGIEGRVDTADLDIRSDGVNLDLRLGGLLPIGSVAVGAGAWDLERLVVLSVNARVRTRGRVGLIASGGLSYLPRFAVSGSVPLRVSPLDLFDLPAVSVGLRLVARPGASSAGLGGNLGGGVGVRLNPQVTLLAEGRIFGFRTFDLTFASDNPDLPLDVLVGDLPLLEFNPAHFQAGVGFVLSF